MAKKELRRAARGPQRSAPSRGMRGGPPTVRGSLTQGAIMAAIYFALIEVITRATGSQLLANLLLALLFFMIFAVFTYFWQGFLYRRRMRKREEERK